MKVFASSVLLAASAAAFSHIDPEVPGYRKSPTPVKGNPGEPLLKLGAAPAEHLWNSIQ
jgi:hypothetical protein